MQKFTRQRHTEKKPVFALARAAATACLFAFSPPAQAQPTQTPNTQPSTTSPIGTYTNHANTPPLADPHVLQHEGKYYLYGTGSSRGRQAPHQGFEVFVSEDLSNWEGPAGATDGYALIADNSWGRRMFWAPEVIAYRNVFLMYYTVEEHLAVAIAQSPLGPFKQIRKQPLHLDTKEIDPHVFFDDDGTAYLYFVRFTKGNEIWVAKLNPDMRSIDESTLTHCIGQSQDWEKSQDVPAQVNEGAFVVKHKGTYYLTYSANHYQSKDYGVGYATADSPMGPWTKHPSNPILQSNEQVHGAGHHSLVPSPDGQEWFIVYHTHHDLSTIHPRKLAIDRIWFEADPNGGPDVLKVKGPTLDPQPLPSGSPGLKPKP